jgi:hypothetical protein
MLSFHQIQAVRKHMHMPWTTETGFSRTHRVPESLMLTIP